MSKMLKAMVIIMIVPIMFMGCGNKENEKTIKDDSSNTVAEKERENISNGEIVEKNKNESKEEALEEKDNGENVVKASEDKYLDLANKEVNKSFPKIKDKSKIINEYIRYLNITDEIERISKVEKWDKLSSNSNKFEFRKDSTIDEEKNIYIEKSQSDLKLDINNLRLNTIKNTLQVLEEEDGNRIAKNLTYIMDTEKTLSNDMKNIFKIFFEGVDLNKLDQDVKKARDFKAGDEVRNITEYNLDNWEGAISVYPIQNENEDIVSIAISIEVFRSI